MLDIREIVRRIQAGDGDRRIARDMQIRRKTVTKYRAWATAVGWDRSPWPDPAALQGRLGDTLPVLPPPKAESSAVGFRGAILA